MQPFLCLEVCGSTHDQIEQNIYQVARNPSLFNAVSFEAYNLGPNSTLIRNNLTDAAAQFKYVAGLRAVAMISSYPYPPQFIDYMRQVFDNPQPFIQQCILECVVVAATPRSSPFTFTTTLACLLAQSAPAVPVGLQH